jgi:hypothetical protein
MTEGKKFRPVITRVKLNPEQAVLACCSNTGRKGQIRGTNQCNRRSATCGFPQRAITS